MDQTEVLREEIPTQFKITMIGPSRYELADSKTGEFFELKKISKLSSKAYNAFLLELGNGSKRYAFFKLDKKNNEYVIYCSDPFEELIEEFTDSILVKTHQGKKLIHHHTTKFLSWGEFSNKSHELKILTNGRQVILRNDFEMSEDFEDVILHRQEESSRDYQIRIVVTGCKQGSEVIRIRDLKTMHVTKATYTGEDEKYLKLVLLNGKEAVLRTDDFEVSEPHKVVEVYAKCGYAFASDDGEEFFVIRLSDFATFE